MPEERPDDIGLNSEEEMRRNLIEIESNASDIQDILCETKFRELFPNLKPFRSW